MPPVTRRTQRALKAVRIPALALFLALFLVALANIAMPMPVFADTSGPSNAGTGTNVNGPGTISWTSAVLITAYDGNYATATPGKNETSEYLQGTNYGFSIPLDATINGITVSIMRMSSSASGGDSVNDVDLYLLKAGVIAGTNHAYLTDWPTSITAATYGGPADLWGTTWTPAQINATNFGVSISAYNQAASNRTASVDCMQITATYTLSTTTAVISSLNPSTYGTSVTFTATVTGSGGTNTPGGTVDFYDGATTIGSSTLSGSGGEATATFATSSLTAGSHAIAAVYNGDSNFSGSTGILPGGQTVSNRNITVTADAKSKTFGDTDPPLTYQITSGSLASGDAFTGVLTRNAGEAVGTHTISQGTLALNGNYSLTYVGANLTIALRNITVTTDANSKTFGDTDPALTYQITSGSLASGDAFTGALTRNAGEAVGTYAIIQGTLALSSNYTLTYVGGNLTIALRNIAVTANAGQTKVYGTADPVAFGYTHDPLVGSDSFSGALARVAGEDVGLYGITQGTLALSSNYTLIYVGANLTISPKTIDASIAAADKRYDGTDAAAITGRSLTGVVGGDNVSLTGGTATFGDNNVGTGKAVTATDLSLAGADAGNYALSSSPVTTTATITQRDLTVTVTGINKVYDGSIAATVNLSTDALESDTVTASYTSASFADKNAGTRKAVSVGGISISGSDAGNYNLVNTTASTTANITPKDLTITANDRGKTYDDTVTFAGTEFTAMGLVNADSVTSVTLTSTGAAAGATVDGSPYSIVPSAVLGIGLSNYNITYVNGSLTVNKASIALTMGSSVTTSTQGRLVTFTTTVTSTGATGTVTFEDRGSTLGSSTLSNGTATYTISTLSVGSHSITAVYSGDAIFAASMSSAVDLTVKAAAGFSWALIGGILVAAAVMGLFFLLVIYRRRRKQPSGAKEISRDIEVPVDATRNGGPLIRSAPPPTSSGYLAAGDTATSNTFLATVEDLGTYSIQLERELEASLTKVMKSMEATIRTVSHIVESKDPYVAGHQKRVSQLACAIAKEMRLTAWQIDGIRVAGMLHDIGKIIVPTEILSKPGKLSEAEFSMIRDHPKLAFDILKNIDFDWPIARIVVQHHERMDGSGYPYGILGKDILMEARILAVADVVEAMSSHRPYRPALGIEEALAELTRGDGTLYASEVVRACEKVINKRGFKLELGSSHV